MYKHITICLLWLTWICGSAAGQTATHHGVHAAIDSIIKPFKGTIGVAASRLETQDTIVANNMHHYPMQSVFKFPLALLVLDKVDRGTLSLDQKIHISKEELHQTWSPLKDKFPEGNIDLTIAELLEYTVSKSDNNTCDILFKLAGGTSAVDKYLHKNGIKNIMVAANEQEMARGWDIQYTNWAEPNDIVRLLTNFYRGKLLSEKSTKLLLKMMTESENSPNRIKGLLPAGTIVAHKTGTSNTNDAGMTAAVNDVGIVELPGGKHFAIAVFVSNSTETRENCEKIIAQITRAVYDYYNKK